jgi:hypothetical protein
MMSSCNCIAYRNVSQHGLIGTLISFHASPAMWSWLSLRNSWSSYSTQTLNARALMKCLIFDLICIDVSVIRGAIERWVQGKFGRQLMTIWAQFWRSLVTVTLLPVTVTPDLVGTIVIIPINDNYMWCDRHKLRLYSAEYTRIPRQKLDILTN